MSRQKRD